MTSSGWARQSADWSITSSGSAEPATYAPYSTRLICSLATSRLRCPSDTPLPNNWELEMAWLWARNQATD